MFRKIPKKASISLSQDSEIVLPTVLTHPKKRPRGLEMPSLPTQPVPDDQKLIQKVFVKSSDRLEVLQNTHMERYINERIGKPASQPVAKPDFDPVKSLEKELYAVPTQYQVQEGVYEDANERTNWLAGLAEVPLTMQHKLDNIEQTENSKRKLMKTGQGQKSRFGEIHYEEVEAFHARRLQGKEDEALYKQLEKEFKMTRRDRKLEEEKRRQESREVESLSRPARLHSP